MARSTFDFKGLSLGSGDKNITYLYGLSDFWAIMFEGSDKIDLLLEANSQSCSDIYSKFLQLTSTLSLEQVQTDLGYQTKLVLINDSYFVNGSVNTYNLPELLTSARFLADRPMLPNLLLEQNVHFSLLNDGTQIQFYKPLNSLGFPVRINVDGSKDYAIWFTDAQVDEFVIYNYYGKLIELSPHTSTQNFKNFVQGLFYLYVNGPTVEWIRKGLNLALGVPLARATEVVLDIRKYLDNNQYLVTTDSNSYLIPFGLAPSVAVDDVLNLGDPLAEWIEVVDWKEKDNWWINLYIPPQLITYIPVGEIDRHALPGSYADYLMTNYLKTHSFLVNILVIDQTNLEFLTQIPTMLRRAKPIYTYPVYIWSVPNDEIMDLSDTDFHYRLDQFKCENLSVPINQMTRNVVFGNFYQNLDYLHLTASNGGKSVTRNGSSSPWGSAKTDFGKASGKWYWEVTIVTGTTGIEIGVGNENTLINNYAGSDTNSWAYSNNDGVTAKKVFNTILTTYGALFVPTNIIGIALDLDAKTIEFYKNGVSQGVAFTGLTGNFFYPIISLTSAAAKITANFGDSPFTYSVPSQYIGGFYDKLSLSRSCPQFIRSNISYPTQQLIGGSTDFNGLSTNLDGGTVTGFVNVENQYRNNTNQESAWLRTIFTRKTNEPISTRGKIILNRRGVSAGVSNISALTSSGLTATATFNPYASWDRTLSSTNMTISGNSVGHNNDNYTWGTAVSTVGITSDKWYWENTLSVLPFPSRLTIGVGDQSVANGNSWMGLSDKAWGVDIEKRNVLNFNGLVDYVTVASRPAINVFGLGSQSFSIALRFRIATLPGLGNVYDLFSKGNNGPFNPAGIGVEIRVKTTGAIEAVKGDGVVTPITISTAAASVTVNTDHYVVFAYDGVVHKLYLYLNGIPSASNGLTSNATNNYLDTWDILLANGRDAPLPGSLWDVRVFSRVLSATEALERYNYFNKNDFSQVGYWPLQEGTGITSLDGSGFQSNGTFNGAPFWNTTTIANTVHNGVKTPLGTTVAQSDVIGMVYNASNTTLSLYKNDTFVTSLVATGTLFPMMSINTINVSVLGNMGSNTFQYLPKVAALPGIYDKTKAYQYAAGQKITISGATNSGYNGTFAINEVGPNTFTYTLAGGQPSPDSSTSILSTSYEGLPTSVYEQFGESNIVYPLYITTQADLANKFTAMALPTPALSTWVFSVFEPTNGDGPINSYAINDNISNNYFVSLVSYYTTLFTRGTNINYLGTFMPVNAFNYTYAPSIADLMPTDYVLFVRIQENTVGVYWVTNNANPTVPAPVYFGLKQIDPVNVSMNAALSRGLGPTGSPFYTLRGDSYTMSYNNDREINKVPINDTETLPSLVQVTYTDLVNSNVLIDRSGARITITKELS